MEPNVVLNFEDLPEELTMAAMLYYAHTNEEVGKTLSALGKGIIENIPPAKVSYERHVKIFQQGKANKNLPTEVDIDINPEESALWITAMEVVIALSAGYAIIVNRSILEMFESHRDHVMFTFENS